MKEKSLALDLRWEGWMIQEEMEEIGEVPSSAMFIIEIK
jgi:hypothetical protein